MHRCTAAILCFVYVLEGLVNIISFHGSRYLDSHTEVDAEHNGCAQKGSESLEEKEQWELPPRLLPEQAQREGHGRVQMTTYRR